MLRVTEVVPVRNPPTKTLPQLGQSGMTYPSPPTLPLSPPQSTGAESSTTSKVKSDKGLVQIRIPVSVCTGPLGLCSEAVSLVIRGMLLMKTATSHSYQNARLRQRLVESHNVTFKGQRQ